MELPRLDPESQFKPSVPVHRFHTGILARILSNFRQKLTGPQARAAIADGTGPKLT